MTLFKLTNKIGAWYVIAENPNTAVELLERELDKKNYGYSANRKVTSIDYISDEIKDDKFSLSSGATLLIQTPTHDR